MEKKIKSLKKKKDGLVTTKRYGVRTEEWSPIFQCGHTCLFLNIFFPLLLSRDDRPSVIGSFFNTCPLLRPRRDLTELCKNDVIGQTGPKARAHSCVPMNRRCCCSTSSINSNSSWFNIPGNARLVVIDDCHSTTRSSSLISSSNNQLRMSILAQFIRAFTMITSPFFILKKQSFFTGIINSTCHVIDQTTLWRINKTVSNWM